MTSDFFSLDSSEISVGYSLIGIESLYKYRQGSSSVKLKPPNLFSSNYFVKFFL